MVETSSYISTSISSLLDESHSQIHQSGSQTRHSLPPLGLARYHQYGGQESDEETRSFNSTEEGSEFGTGLPSDDGRLAGQSDAVQEVPELFTLDSFTVSQETIGTAKKYSRLTAKKEYEVIIEDVEVLLRDLENSDDPTTRYLAPSIIRFYQHYNQRRQLDATEQQTFQLDYLADDFHLPWLLPIVRDVKKVYKRQLADAGESTDQFTSLQTKQDEQEFQKGLAEFNRNPVRSQDLIDVWFNYRPVLPTNSQNKAGAQVFRQLPPNSQPNWSNLQLRASHGEVKSYDFLYKTKGRGKDKFIVGKEEITRLQAERLQVIGFVQLAPAWPVSAGLMAGHPSHPTSDIASQWNKTLEKIQFLDQFPGSIEEQKTAILKELLPDVNRLLNDLDFTGVTSLPLILRIFQIYGHTLESLTRQNKETLSKLLTFNLDSRPTIYYEKARRTVISKLEDELTGSPILTDQLLNQKALSTYDLQIDPLMTSQLDRFFKVIRKADGGRVWLRTLHNQSISRIRRQEFKIDKINAVIQKYEDCPSPEEYQGQVVLLPANLTTTNLHQTCLWDSQQNKGKGKYLSKQEYLKAIQEKPLFTPIFQEADVNAAVRDYEIINNFLQVQRGLLTSYANMWLKMGPDPSLLADLENPLDALWGLKPEARDREAWKRYFQKASLDGRQQNYLFKGKWLGCRHDYDRLHQMFEDPSDSYPDGKIYTQMQQNNGIICGFCGEELQPQDDLTTQGYDTFGRKINTYDNTGLLRVESTIQEFFRQKSEAVLFASTKVLDPWNHQNQELPLTSEFSRSKGRVEDRESKNPQKYEILARYQQFIQDSIFEIGLEQDPNKLPKKVDETKFLKFLSARLSEKQIKITQLSAWFLQRLNPLFVTIDRTYELIIKRMAVLLVSLNWWLVKKEVKWLNPNEIINTWNPSLLGRVFLQSLNFQYIQMIRRMKDIGVAPEDLKKDLSWDHFQKDFRQFFRASQPDLTAAELEAEILKQYRIMQKHLLYTQNVIGDLFDGTYPLEHEIVRFFNDYLTDQGLPDLHSLLKTTYHQYWNQYLTDTKRQQEIAVLRRKQLQAEGSEFQLTGLKAPELKSSQPRRQLYQRYLAQQIVVGQKQLSQAYLNLINEYIYDIRDSQLSASEQLSIGTSDEILAKKTYYLGKMVCDDWKNLTDLRIAGVDEQILLMEQIRQIRMKITHAGDQIGRNFFWQFTGSQLQVDYRADWYPLYITKVLAVPSQSPMRMLQSPNNFQVPKPSAEVEKMTQKMDDLNKLFKELSFIKNPAIPTLIERLGDRFYLDDLKKAEKIVTQIVNGQFYDARVCVQERELTYPVDQFNQDWTSYIKIRHQPEKIKIRTLKKFIISYVRHYIALFSNLNKENWQTFGLLERFNPILRQDPTDLAEAFSDFKMSLTNEQLENYIDQAMGQPKQWSHVIQVLQYILVKDLSEHLRQLKISTGQFKGRGGKSSTHSKSNGRQTKTSSFQKGGASTITNTRASNMNSYEIFQFFCQQLFLEIELQYQISNVEWDHKEINQSFNQRAIWDTQNKIKSQDSLDWKILKYQLSVNEYEEAVTSSGPELDTQLVENEDDLTKGNEMDFSLGDDGNDYAEEAD